MSNPSGPWSRSASGAAFTAGRRYRLALWRNWNSGEGRILFVGLNPSSADESRDDPTLRRCIGFARRWGYGGLLMANLFALRATRPQQLRAARDPVGDGTDRWLAWLAADAAMIVACWGNHGSMLDRDRAFSARQPRLWCLRRNRDGAPAHPLYLPGGVAPRRWHPSFRGR